MNSTDIPRTLRALAKQMAARQPHVSDVLREAADELDKSAATISVLLSLTKAVQSNAKSREAATKVQDELDRRRLEAAGFDK